MVAGNVVVLSGLPGQDPPTAMPSMMSPGVLSNGHGCTCDRVCVAHSRSSRRYVIASGVQSSS